MRLLLKLLGPVSLVLLISNLGADTLISTTPFSYTGGLQYYTIPQGADYITVKAWGAGGGAGVVTQGGAGAFVDAGYVAIPGQILTVSVGGGGSGFMTGGWPNGGSAAGLGGAGGGGYTRVTGYAVEAIAGAGGGGGNGGSWGGVGGAGGGPNGQNGGGPGATFGGGGTYSNGGPGGTGDVGNGTAGSQFQGGNSNVNSWYIGGGGGGGWWGAEQARPVQYQTAAAAAAAVHRLH